MKAKQGRNQKGLCFVSENSSIENGVYQISFKGRSLLSDVRTSNSVPNDIVVLDTRVFRWLSCNEDDDIDLQKITVVIPTCSNIRLTLSSTRDLDNRKIADAISKRVNDLHDDFDGLILQVGQSFQIDRLGIRFTIQSLDPIDSDNKAARITWNELGEIHLDPVESIKPVNIICIFEVGAAAQISDVDTDGSSMPRYQASLEAIQYLSEIYSDSSSKAQFRGFAYSDEIIPFTMFDPQTGSPIEVSTVHSHSLFIRFSEWIESLISEHKGRPSSPGEALEIGLLSTKDFTNSLPTLILFFSSGIHTYGPNPVKIVKSHETMFPILCFAPGKKSNHDLLEAIAEISKGKAIIVTTESSIRNLVDAITNVLVGGH
jgi:hypothetical protein